MEGKITISSKDVIKMVTDWVKINHIRGEPRIIEINARHTYEPELDIRFTDEPEEEETNDDGNMG